ncbi:unnamed protein product [Rhizoctonia solani]|uniref:Uncharacterized protein n=1 Tax=Rhizoctonia solani TaxID=456999 RepID=A0A8H3E1R8_9AGAM|nr:unnamed protein product [Rhizoctonia solani]
MTLIGMGNCMKCCLSESKLSPLIYGAGPYLPNACRDHEYRQAWMGHSFPLDLGTLPIRSEEIPLQYTLLKLGYSSIITSPSIEERKAAGKKIEQTLRGDKEAAPAPNQD